MRINVDSRYNARADFSTLGYVGEVNARRIEVSAPTVEGAELYSLRFEYSDGKAYDVEIIDGTVLVQGSLLRSAGLVKIQWTASAKNGGTYTLVAKSSIISVRVKASLSDDIAPVPTYERSIEALDKVLNYESRSREYAERAEQAASRAEDAQADISVKAQTVADNADKAARSADTAVQSANKAEQMSASAEQSAASASQSADTASIAAERSVKAALHGLEFIKLTKADFKSLTARSDNTIYYVTDKDKVEQYIGDTKLSSGSVPQLSAVSAQGITGGIGAAVKNDEYVTE